MTFKNNWEQAQETLDAPSPETLKNMTELAIPTSPMTACQLLSGGCLNLNFKISFQDAATPYILRVYGHHPTAAPIEQALAHILKNVLPVPQIEFIGQYKNQNFALMQYVPGISLREFLLQHPDGKNPEIIETLMKEAGQQCALLQQFTFPRSGFLDAHLKVDAPFQPQAFETEFLSLLNSDSIKEKLGTELLQKIGEFVNRHKELLALPKTSCLAHGDFDPANIFIKKNHGEWRISGILDWEFSYAGNWLNDMANMLRYAHQMPPIFKTAFLKGVTNAGVSLPSHFEESIRLFNMLSLLQILARPTITKRPAAAQDILELLTYMTA